MTDRPIIFSAPMVRALLDGRKTMTRRLAWRTRQRFEARERARLERRGCLWECAGGDCFASPPSPWQRVQPGDRLWVREAHRLTDCECTEACRGPGHVYYDADDSGYRNVAHNRLRPSIHMPRWGSRLTLVVTAVKRERLQRISEADARAEGVADWQAFATLWKALHGEASWGENPEVVALTFAMHRCNIDAMERAAA